MEIKDVRIIRTKVEQLLLSKYDIEQILERHGKTADDFQLFEDFLLFAEDELEITDDQFSNIDYEDEYDDW